MQATKELPGTVLVVDDTPENQDILLRILNKRGFRASTAGDGRAALQAAQSEPPDIILLDINMPDMTGYEVCEQLKANPKTRDIPVIFISALSDLQDKVRGFQVGGVDYITKPFEMAEVVARVRSHFTLVQQRRQIEALSKLKDDLIRTVSHDLKNPISNVLGYTSLLLSFQDFQAERDQVIDFLQIVHKSAKRMNQLVEDLLDLSRIEQGLPLMIKELSLIDLLNEVLVSFKLAAEQKGVTLAFEPPPDDPPMTGDFERLNQVFSNLVGNAIKYTPSGGSVTLAAYFDHDEALVQVADTGLGIPPDALPHVFEKFYRINTQAHMGEKGTGLGLAITQAIVEQHGGRIWVESALGNGSLFNVALPLSKT